MSNVSGNFFIGMVTDGDRVDGNLRASAPLVQMYKSGTDACIPDWTVAANQPTIYPVLRSQNAGTIKTVVSGSEKWYYNGVEITFSNSVATAPAVIAGKVKSVTSNNGSVDVPSLQFIGNVAGADNTDADTIRMTGSVEASGRTLAFDMSINLAISEYVDSAYTGFLSATNGGIIDEEGETTVVSQSLYKGGAKMTSGYSVKWLKAPYTSAFSTADSVTISQSDIDSRLNLMCQFIVDGEVKDTKLITLSDETDPYFISVNLKSGSMTLEETGTNSTCVLEYAVKKMGSGDTISGFTFSTLFTNAAGNTFTPATAATATGCTLTYQDAVNAGGNITGFITATK